MSDWFEDGNLLVDYRGCRVWLDGEEVHLSALRFRILHYLTQNAGKSLSPRDILRFAWMDEQYDVGLVRWHIARLRRDLGDNEHDRIVHVRGFGYRYDKASENPVRITTNRPRARRLIPTLRNEQTIQTCAGKFRNRNQRSRLKPMMAS